MLGFYLVDGKVQRIADMATDNIVGNIYCGLVSDLVKNIDAAFVSIGSQKGFLSTKKCEEPLKCGDKVLVQVEYDAIKTKDYGLTTNISLTGNALVLTVGNHAVSISKKIQDVTKRNALKQMMEPYRNSEYGFILRTQSEFMTKEEICSEAERLIAQWQDIQRKFTYAKPKEILLSQNKIVETAKKYAEMDAVEIITDRQEIAHLLGKEKIPFRLFETGKVSLCNLYRLDKTVEECLSNKVWLRSGAYLVIDYTEALTVIDVNSGKAEIKGNKEDVIFEINREAMHKIAEQIELRNLSGIILIDFINMKNSQRKEEIEKELNEILLKQSVYAKAYGFTKLGLMEMSRKKKDKPFHEIL
jgi:ribonuclease G